MSRATAQRVLPAVVSIGVLVWLVSGVDGQGLLDALSWRVAFVMIPSLLAYGAATLLLEAVSIRLLLEHPPADFDTWTAARIKCASYLLGILNYALGAAALTVLLRRRTTLSLAGAASLILLITSTDLVVVLSVVGIGALFLEAIAPSVRGGLLVVGILGFAIGLVVLRAPGSLGPLEPIRQLTIFYALRTVPLADFARLVALRTLFVACFVGIAAISFPAFGTHAPVAQIVTGMLVVGFVAGLPIAVAGLGTSQATFLFLFRDAAPEEHLLAQSLVLQAGMLVLRALMGVVFAREYTQEALRETRREPN